MEEHYLPKLKLVRPEDSSQPNSHYSEPPDPPACPYGKCNGNGLIYIEKEDGYTASKHCQCLKDRTKMRFLGERFYRVTLDHLEPKTERQGLLKGILVKSPNTSVFLFGRGGEGKTHFLAAMYNYWDSKGRRIKYFEDGTLRDELREAELKGDTQVFFDIVRDHDCIFIDDVGKQPMTAFYKGALYRFFNEAYKHHKYLFITANDRLDVLGADEYWGPHATRRIEDLCHLAEF